MNAKIDKSIFRTSTTLVVPSIAAIIVLVISWSFTFIPGISDSNMLNGIIYCIGAVAGILTGIITFSKTIRYLRDEMEKL